MSELAVIEKEICESLDYNTEEQLTNVALNAYKNVKQAVIQFGMILVKGKELLPHGHFQNWIDENFDFSLRTANNYMNTALRFYPRWQEIENMDKSSFKALKAMSKEIQEEILAQEEIDGKSLAELSKEDIVNYEEKRKAEIKLLEMKNKELKDHLKEKEERIKEQEEQIQSGMDQLQEMKEENYQLRKPENKEAIQEKETGIIINEAIISIRQAGGMELSEKAKARFISDLTASIADLKEAWGM